MKNITIFGLLFFSLIVKSQSITGYVYDDVSKIPLEGAIVYLDGTTINASTNDKGYFELKTPTIINALLVVNYMGYERYMLQDPFSNTTTLSVYLKEQAINLQEVVINKKQLYSRKQMLRAFKDQFLGVSTGGKACVIENEDDIILNYEVPDNILTAQVVKPLTIINKRLGYKVIFDLMEFKTYYKMKSIESVDVNSSFFAGTTTFIEIKNDKGIQGRRKKIYEGSPLHFMRTIASGEWEKEKFQLYIDKFPEDHKDYFKVTDTLDNFKKVKVAMTIPHKLNSSIQLSSGSSSSGTSFNSPATQPAKIKKYTIMYNKKLQSFVTFNKGEFYIDEHGLFIPVTEVYFGGHMAFIKTGDMLPADYQYAP